MSNPNIQQNLAPVKAPELQDLLNLREKNLKLGFNCIHVGTIQSFNSTLQTVTATVAYKKTFLQYNETTNQYVPSYIDYPIMTDVPAIFLGGGRIRGTFPVSKGDECLLLFNDRDIDNWFQSGQSGPVASQRTHSFSDAFALVGVNSTPNVINGFDAIHGCIKDYEGGAMMGVAGSLVRIANNTTTLNTLLQSLISILSSASTVSGGPFQPGVVTALTNLGTQIGELLE